MIDVISIISESDYEPMIDSKYAFYEDDTDALINVIYYIAKTIDSSELRRFLVRKYDDNMFRYTITFLYNFDTEKLIVSAFENGKSTSNDYIVIRNVGFDKIKAIIAFLELYVYDENFVSSLDTSALA